MNTETEINELKKRVERIEKFCKSVEGFLNETFFGVEKGSDKHQCKESYELISFDVQKSQSVIGPEYAYRLKIRNSSDDALQLMGKIIFLDKNDFEVYSEYTGAFSIDGKSEFVKAGRVTIIDQNHAGRISNVTAQVNPM